MIVIPNRAGALHNMIRLHKADYNNEITSSEDAIKDYVQNYLQKNAYLMEGGFNSQVQQILKDSK